MGRKVLKKQFNSKKCFVCGLRNEYGLKASFYEIENNEVVAFFKPLVEHQGYQGMLHGGIIAAILDETIARAVMINNAGISGVTVELNMSYKKPVPVEQELRVIGRITKESRRLFEGTGEILLSNGDIAASAAAKYIKMPIDKITNFNEGDEKWEVVINGSEPDEIEL